MAAWHEPNRKENGNGKVSRMVARVLWQARRPSRKASGAALAAFALDSRRNALRASTEPQEPPEARRTATPAS
jgi:hypothetical protein